MAPTGTYFAFHPGSAWPGKRWPEAHWAALAEACVQSGHAVVLTGSPEERPAVDRMLSSLSASARAGGPRLVRTHHLAGRGLDPCPCPHDGDRGYRGHAPGRRLRARPTLALFGPSNPVETGPYGRGHFVLQTSLDLGATSIWTRDMRDWMPCPPSRGGLPPGRVRALRDLLLGNRPGIPVAIARSCAAPTENRIPTSGGPRR